MITVLCYDFHLHPKAHHIFDDDFILSRFYVCPAGSGFLTFNAFYNYSTYDRIGQEPTLSISIKELSLKT